MEFGGIKMLEQFTEAKKQLLSFVGQLEKADFVDKDILGNSRIEEEVERLGKGDFKISLVAPFSAGKSTFINAIIGKDLLSMDIRAETSVITKISYSENIKIEITYHENSKKEIIDCDNEGNPITYESCRQILKNITTVRDENNEVKIKEVIVYCPLEICKDNVELIDTPGLFSRHEKHESITNNILPQVNAVIFMIDPDSVGEEHFTDKIQNYVASAKNSNLEEDGKHIFFVINKIDVFDPEDIEKSREELIEVLQDILRTPQIHEVSAYFGMVGKQLAAGDIDISAVQKDRKIKIPDPLEPEYTIAGRQIGIEHAENIIDFSKIRGLESSLGSYLQDKNEYLLKDVKSSIKQILSDSINKMKYQLGEINTSLEQDSTEYIAKMDNLKNEWGYFGRFYR
jgi:GTPase SAR1 family protein